MASHKYEIREICGDWALDIHWGKETIKLFFNSRNNAELVKSILEWEDAHPNAAVPYNPTLTQPNEPLTIEQLREMDGEPVYVVPKDKPAHCGGWCGVTVWKCDRYSYVSLLRDADSGWGFEKYGKTWIAYRRPPEGDGGDVGRG